MNFEKQGWGLILIQWDDNEYDFTYQLSDKEIECIAQQKFVDFHAILRRTNKQGGGPGPKVRITLPAEGVYEIDASQPPHHPADMSFEIWNHIFLSFIAEHLRHFPNDGRRLARYQERILRMASAGKDWSRYDEVYRRKRAAYIKRKLPAMHGKQWPKPKTDWHQTDMELYFSCIEGKDEPAHQKSHPGKSATASAQPPSKSAIALALERGLMPNTCWKFQDYGKCDGSCSWPETHCCYKCSGKHQTSRCPGSKGQPEPPKSTHDRRPDGHAAHNHGDQSFRHQDNNGGHQTRSQDRRH